MKSNNITTQSEIDLRKPYQIIIIISILSGLAGMIGDTVFYIQHAYNFLTFINIVSILIFIFVSFAKLSKIISTQSLVALLVLTMVVNILFTNIYSAHFNIPEWQFNFLRGTLIILVFVSISGLILSKFYLILINLLYISTLYLIVTNNSPGYISNNAVFLMLFMPAYSFAIFMFMKKLKVLIKNNTKLNNEIIQKNNEVHTKDKELRIEKAKSLEQTIDHKNRELLSNAMLLSQYFESREKLIKSLSSIAEKLDEVDACNLKEIISDLAVTRNSLNWGEFQKRFEDIHKDFYNNIVVAFPDLSPAEIKLAAFIKLGLSSKEIAALTNTSTGSIEVSRSRLRKKLNLKTSENLAKFLFNFN